VARKSFNIGEWPILNKWGGGRMAQPTFHGDGQSFHADTCAPLEAAAKRGLCSLHALAHGQYPGTHLPTRLLPEIRSIGYWDARKEQPWGLPWHRNEGIEFTYLMSGRLAFATDQKAVMLKPGNLTITRPWQRHRVGDPNATPSQLHWVILDVGVRRPNQPWRWPDWLVLSPAERRALTTLLSHNEQCVWAGNAAVMGCFEKLGRLLATSTEMPERTRLVLCVNELLLAVMEMLRGRDIKLDRTLTSAQRVVQMFLAELPRRIEQQWTVDTMAQQCGLGRSRFVHYCRQITNMSPLEYLTHCRVEAAKQLLQQRPEMSVTQVALACGFSTSQYFATVFRRMAGHAPREVRRMDVG
jgi:AraC-like DNA-binding protein